MLRWPNKSPTEMLDYAIDWARELAEGEAIVSGTYTITHGSVSASVVSVAGTQTVVFLSGGVKGECCLLTANIVTSEGRDFTQCVEISITTCGSSVTSTTTKRTLVEMAYEEAGLPGYEFSASPEELFSGIRRLDAMMSEWPCGEALGYNFPVSIGTSDPGDSAGVPDWAVMAIVGKLAQKLAPGLGKDLSSAQKAASAQSYSIMLGRIPIPQVRVPRTTPIGAGNRRRSPWYPFALPAERVCCT